MDGLLSAFSGSFHLFQKFSSNGSFLEKSHITKNNVETELIYYNETVSFSFIFYFSLASFPQHTQFWLDSSYAVFAVFIYPNTRV
jgi:hypothetical protein